MAPPLLVFQPAAAPAVCPQSSRALPTEGRIKTELKAGQARPCVLGGSYPDSKGQEGQIIARGQDLKDSCRFPPALHPLAVQPAGEDSTSQ